MALNRILTNGAETGSTLAGKMNAVVDLLNSVDLDTLPTELQTIGQDITLLQQEVDLVEQDIIDINTELSGKIAYTDRGLLSLTTTVETVQPLTTTDSKISWVDSVYLNNNAGVTYDNLTKRLTFTGAGVYQLFVQGNVEAGNGRELKFKWYRNGVDITQGTSAVFVAAGVGKPISVGDSRFLQVAANDYLEVFALADAATDLTIKASSLDVIKTCAPI